MSMFANIRSRLVSVIAPDMPALPSSAGSTHREQSISHRLDYLNFPLRLSQQQHLQDKFPYARPPFLQLLSNDELKASADHNVRPIIVPRDISLLPWGTGYAECVNSGKSEWNEDQASFCQQILSDPSHCHPDLPYTYFGIFDGHAGYGAALAASHQFHHILHEKLVDCIDLLLPRDDIPSTQPATSSSSTAIHNHHHHHHHHNPKSSQNNSSSSSSSSSNDSGNATTSGQNVPQVNQFQRTVDKDELIIGALESAFNHMDALIAQDRDRYRDAGGCTACVTLFINGKMYVANAGDSRAILCQRRKKSTDSNSKSHTDAKHNPNNPSKTSIHTADKVVEGTFATPFSFDHTPETERARLLNVAQYKPHLLGKYYIDVEYIRRPHEKDLGQRILCRQGTMKGWTYKTLTREDLRIPVVTGEGKRSRLLGTLGVTRGFGDHDLLAIATRVLIKPFLTSQPEVKFKDLTKIVSIPDEHNEDGDYGVLVMATDGLWDVSENEIVSKTVFQTLHKYSEERHRYTMAAQELVARARGKINDYGHWRLADSKAAATVDDISVIVIPVYQYYKEHVEWEQRCVREYKERQRILQATEAKEIDNSSVTAAFINGAQNTTAAATATAAAAATTTTAAAAAQNTKFKAIAIAEEAVTVNAAIRTNPGGASRQQPSQTKVPGSAEVSEPDLIPKSMASDFNSDDSDESKQNSENSPKEDESLC